MPDADQHLWSYKSRLRSGLFFGQTKEERGKDWREYAIIVKDKLFRDDKILYASVATHSQFVASPPGVVSNKSAPSLLAPLDSDKQVYDELLGFLNSSTVCFWLKQVCHNKGSSVDQHGARQRTNPFEDFFDHSATAIRSIPLPERDPFICEASGKIIGLMNEMAMCSPAGVLSSKIALGNLKDSISSLLRNARECYRSLLEAAISLQEEIDWRCYYLYGLCCDQTISVITPSIALGQRTFEITLARSIAAGELQSTWFERHGSIPITELPAAWPEGYKKLVQQRIELTEKDPNIRLIEQPEYKRRWNTEPWESQLERALREWLLLRFETYFDFDGRMTDEANTSKKPIPLGEIAMCSVAQLADAARRDPQFMEVGELYRDDPAFDVQALVEELVLAESVPHLPILRYKDSGLRKRAEWEKTWDLQRREDKWQRAKEAEGKSEKLSPEQAEVLKLWPSGPPTTSVPPKYTSADFISTGGARYWSLRGKLDVPKERWISFPHCEGPDGSLVICWAGYDHLQQAQAVSAYYVRVQTEFGGSDDPRLIPLLASLIELLPWLAQWHNEPNANFDGLRMGDYFEGFVNEEARNLGKTLAEIKAWTPPMRTATRSRKKAK